MERNEWEDLHDGPGDTQDEYYPDPDSAYEDQFETASDGGEIWDGECFEPEYDHYDPSEYMDDVESWDGE